MDNFPASAALDGAGDAAGCPAAPAPGPRPWQLAHPLWLCSFRPLFALTLLAGWGLMAAWGAFLFAGLPLPAVAGGPFVWHAHELLLGFTLAAVGGFAMTAVPEFTDSPAFSCRHARWLVALWLLGRAAFWASGAWPQAGLWVSALAHLAFLALLLALLTPRLWRAPDRKHLSLAWTLAFMLAATAGFYFDALRGEPPMRWLHALLGALMALIIVAMSRISMSIVNDSIDRHEAARQQRQKRQDDPEYEATRETARYLARPPRRNMAVLCIALFAATQFAPDVPQAAPVSAWLALAAACAMLNLMGDWHVGRPLLERWPLMLYASYAFMAAGYGLTGLGLLAGFSPNAGLHLLTAGALGLAVLAVVCIAGYTHSGLDKNGRPWPLAAAVMLGASAALRALAYFSAARAWLMAAAAALWCAAFALASWHMLPVFWRARADGATGAAGCNG